MLRTIALPIEKWQTQCCNRLGDQGRIAMACSSPSIESEPTRNTGTRVSVSQVLVYELRVRDAMTLQPVTARPFDSLRDIQGMMKSRKISGLPITKDGKLVGIISIEDIIRALDKGHIHEPAEAWMSRNVISLRDHFSLVRAVAEFDRHEFGRFPVLNSSGDLVGMLTRGDITNCLMHHLERRAEEAVAREAALVAARTTEDDSSERIIIKAQIRSGDFDSAGRISQRLRQVLRHRGIEPDIRRRAAIVAYEAETNIIIHSIGGQIEAAILPDKVTIEALDHGPGIHEVEMAMSEGWSTAGPLARELGFGAGMGLPNIKKCSDTFRIESEMGNGTRLHSEIMLRKAGTPS